MSNLDQNKISPEWLRLMRLCSQVNYGRIEIVIINGKPVRAENVVKQIKLDVPNEFEEALNTIPLG